MSNHMQNYKILIINGQSLNNSNATGITLSSMLKNVPKRNLLEFCFADSNLRSNLINSITIPSAVNPLQHFFLKIAGGNIVKSKLNATIQNDRLIGNSVAVKKKNILKEFIRAHLDAFPIFLDKKTIIMAKEFKPDIVYTLGSNITVLKVAYKISEICNCAILLHFMDNWRASMYNGFSMLYPKFKLLSLIKKIEDKSVAGLAIGDMMADEFNTKSNIKYYALMNAVDSKLIFKYVDNENTTCRIVYTGGLHLNRYKSLLDVQSCLKQLNETGNKATLSIYTSQKDRFLQKLFDDKYVTFHDYVSHDNIYEVYKTADILLHIESFDKDQIVSTKYSMSTKISEYLSAGKPILCYAPKEIAVYKYIEQSKAGYTVCTIDTLKNSLLELILNPHLRKILANNGIETARKRHTYEAATNTLFRAMEENINKIGTKNER